jgi:hypothetical protein
VCSDATTINDHVGDEVHIGGLTPQGPTHRKIVYTINQRVGLPMVCKTSNMYLNSWSYLSSSLSVMIGGWCSISLGKVR